MAKITFDLRRNTDGTITVIYGKYRESFTVNEWDNDAEILEKAKWVLVTAGAKLDWDSFMTARYV